MKRLFGIAAAAVVVGGAPVVAIGSAAASAQFPADTLWRPLQRPWWEYRAAFLEERQARGSERWTTCADGTGLVRGRVLAPEGSGGFERVSVSLHVPWSGSESWKRSDLRCGVVSEEPLAALDFAFAGVPPGDYLLTARGPGLASSPVPVTVAEEESLWLVLPTREENLVDECLRDAECSPFLTRFSGVWTELDPEARRPVFLARLAVAMALGSGEEMQGWTVCLADATPEALREIGLVTRAAPSEACGHGEIEYDGGYVGEGMTGPDGEPAIGVDHGWVYSYPDGTLGADIEYWHASEWAAGWRCRWREVEGVPVPVRCRATWIS